MKPIVIIPVLNPDEKLITLVEKLKKMDLQVIIVDDGSKQECNGIFEMIKSKFNFDVCCHTKNMGKGAAIKTGIRYAALNYPECCGYITADADGQHAAEDIFKVSKTLMKNPDSLVLGSRNFNEKNVPFKSKWGNRITSFVFQLSTGQGCPDTQTGLRGIPKKFTQLCLSVPGDRFEYEMNLLLEFGRNKLLFVHVPIATIYLEDNKSSHFHPMRDSVLIYFNILKYGFSSLASAVIDLSLFTIFITFVFGINSTGILAATLIARFMSGYVNFMINKHWVFKSKNNHGIEVLKYSVLFCCQMMLSSFFVTVLSHASVNLTIIKILVDSTLFFFSYQIQKKYIFHNKRKDTFSDEKVFIKTL